MSIAELSHSSAVLTPRGAGYQKRIGADVLVCLGLLALLIVWAIIFPQTGDGDAIMHYLNARDSLWQPAKLLGSWARVGAKIPLLIPAQFGILAARCMSVIISVLCAWETIRLADDLGIRRAWLAGPMLIFQPFVFALAGDTMTELPLALGLVIAIRLWMARRILASCLVMGYLPTVRPEGFFLCALWAAMVIGYESGERWNKLALVLTLGWGTAAWLAACWVVHKDVNYLFSEWWSWPADSMRIYGRGSFFAYANRWPIYCGPVLFPLFLAGVGASLWGRDALPFGSRLNGGGFIVVGGALIVLELLAPSGIRENILPWAALGAIGVLAWFVRRRTFAIGAWVFFLIFGLHSVLWWRGWFASCGLMRIMACVGPISAIVCLHGWNVIADWVGGMRRIVGVAGIVAMGAAAMGFYVVEPTHQRIFPLERACEFVAQNGLLANAPRVILGDPMAQACLRMGPNPGNVLRNDCDRGKECDHLLQAPIGSVGLWDNQHAQAWFGVSLSDLPTLGYAVLFEVHRRPAVAIEWLERANLPRDQIYVVIRKDRAGRMPADLSPG
jgi:hypothetical protein